MRPSPISRCDIASRRLAIARVMRPKCMLLPLLPCDIATTSRERIASQTLPRRMPLFIQTFCLKYDLSLKTRFTTNSSQIRSIFAITIASQKYIRCRTIQHPAMSPADVIHYTRSYCWCHPPKKGAQARKSILGGLDSNSEAVFDESRIATGNRPYWRIFIESLDSSANFAPKQAEKARFF